LLKWFFWILVIWFDILEEICFHILWDTHCVSFVYLFDSWTS
jgi:hypothetical protein